jgi:flagellar biosynthesis protein FlhA
LASQIPSFLIAIAAGLIVARAGNRAPLGLEIPNQLVSQPAALGLVAGFLVILSFTPLPTIPLLVLAALLGSLSWANYKQQQEFVEENVLEEEFVVEDNIPTQTPILLLELGRSLLPLVSQKTNDNIVDKMASLRVSVEQNFGFEIPAIRIKDNMDLEPNTYRIMLRGGIVGEGVAYVDRLMIIANEDTGSDIDGIHEREPSFGMSAVWVTEKVLNGLGELFVQAMGPVAVVMTHISTVVHHHASELLTREDVSRMVEVLRVTSPHLVEEEIGTTVSISRLHHILKCLLQERVPIRDLATIIESASDASQSHLEVCVEKVRHALKRQICATVSFSGMSGKQIIRCVDLPGFVEEQVLQDSITKETFSKALHQAAMPLLSEGLPIVVVSSHHSRRKMQEYIAKEKDEIVVLSRDEIVSEVDLQVVGSVEVVTPSRSIG